MSQTDLPAVVLDYIEASNRHHVEGYVNAFSEHAVIEENSLGRNLLGRQEIADYFIAYFVKTNTITEIIDFTVNSDVVNMRVLFKGDFAGNEIIGVYQFDLKNGRIEKLKADLE
ncbi:SnoaL-like domain-containing protein [Paenibacillus sp. RU4T]|nr:MULTISPECIES: nuclear transport factor 2 family protein [unclassified Paenibacillus]ASS64931.1 nuclear transport factor 2 family protein [Paenibacillus sp. RUD330]SIR01045.1 SnoaL-like domain-containing protein [Paenibacillus sp. RU4X]SIR33927.1 SnoaL-like domain-containing protein [Paenibacillus sp. RU4T]